MRLPRDISGAELVKQLGRLGYEVTRQVGSHIRLTCNLPHAHNITVPNHAPLRVGTLASILREIAEQRGIDHDELLRKLFQ